MNLWNMKMSMKKCLLKYRKKNFNKKKNIKKKRNNIFKKWMKKQ